MNSHFSFRQRQFLILLTISFLILAIALGVGLPSSRNAIIERETSRLETVADLKTNVIEGWINQGQDVTQHVSISREVKEDLVILLAYEGQVEDGDDRSLGDYTIAERRLNAEIEFIIGIHPHAQTISLLHPTSGQVWLSTDIRQLGRERGEEAYFIEGQRSIYISPVVYSVGSEAPVLIASAPIRDEKENLLAVVAVEMDIDYLDISLTDTTGLDEQFHVYVVDGYGFYIILPPHVEGGPLRIIAESEGISRALAGQSGRDTYLNPTGIPVLGIYRWLEQGNMGLLVEIEEQKLTGEIRHTWMLIALTGIIGMAVASVAAQFLTRWLVSPLERIVAAAQALQAGDLSHRAPTTGPDEIGQLGTAFNEMAASLQQSHQNLEGLVAQRTAQLTSANEQLKKEIAERLQADEALQESEQRYRALFETSPNAIQVLQDGKYILANPAAALMFGLSDPQEVVGLSALDLVAPQYHQATIERVKRVDSGLANEPLEIELILPDGERKITESTSVPIQIQGEPATLIIGRDVTVQVKAQEALQESEALYSDLVETSQDLIWKCDAEGRFTYLNHAWEDTHGYSLEEMLGKSFAEFQTPDIDERDTKEFYNHLTKGSVRGYETTHLSKSGDLIHLSINAKPLFDVDGIMIGTQGTAHDVTERVNAERALRESEGRYRGIFEGVQDAILVESTSGEILDVNSRSCEMFGYTYKEFLTKTVADIVPEEHFAWVPDELPQPLVPGQPIETVNVRASGEHFPVEITGQLQTIGEETVLLVVVRDITDRKHTEEQIKKSLQEKEILIQEIHHRVKNNLQVISSLLDLQSESVQDPQAKQVFLDSQLRVRSMALIHEKLYQSHDMTNIDAASYIEDLVDYLFISYGGLADAISLNIEIEYLMLDNDTAIPCGLIVSELVSNAIKYAFPGDRGGEIRVHLARRDDHFVLLVSDDGVGLPPDLDLESTTSLGLQLVVLLTRQLKGTLELAKHPGTIYKITVPISG